MTLVVGSALPGTSQAQYTVPDHLRNARVFCKITETGFLRCASPDDILAIAEESSLDAILAQVMAELLAAFPETDTPFACVDDGTFFVRGSATTVHAEIAKAVGDCMLRVSPSRANDALGAMLERTLISQRAQRIATVAYMDKLVGDCEDPDNRGIAEDGGFIDGIVNAIKDAWDAVVNWVEKATDADLSRWHTDREGARQSDEDGQQADADADADAGSSDGLCSEQPTEAAQVDCALKGMSQRTGIPKRDLKRAVGDCVVSNSMSASACTRALGRCLQDGRTLGECDPERLDKDYSHIKIIEDFYRDDRARGFPQYPGPDGVWGTSCEQARFKWAAFKERCEQSDWQEFHCDQFLRAINGCVGDPTVTQPPPDQIDACFNQVSEAELERQRCEEQGGIWSDSGEATPNCAFITDPIPTLPAYALCHDPRVDLLQDHCAPTITLPGTAGFPAPDPGTGTGGIGGSGPTQ